MGRHMGIRGVQHPWYSKRLTIKKYSIPSAVQIKKRANFDFNYEAEIRKSTDRFVGFQFYNENQYNLLKAKNSDDQKVSAAIIFKG